MLEYLLQTPVLLAGLLLLATLWFTCSGKRNPLLPPGPPTRPIIGNIAQLPSTSNGRGRLRNLAELVRRYGKDGVATIYFASRPFVFVTDFETIKKILHDDAFSGRPLSTRDSFFKRKGLLFTEGELWKEQRRFALSTLRDFGMGKTWLQDLIIEEAQELIQDIREANGAPIDPNRYFTPSVANVICAISYGQRFSHKDEKFVRLANLIGKNIQIQAKNQLVEFFPFLRFIPFTPFHARYQAWLTNVQELAAFFQTLVGQHQTTLHDSEARDYMHAFLLEAEKQGSKPSSTFTSEQLQMSVINLFGAGTETTATTLAWAIIYLLENPTSYQKVQEEVDHVIGEGSYPTLEDRENLPFTQATIFEIQRLANLVALAGRRTMQEVTLNGYTLPAGTNVFPILAAVHENPDHFPDPLTFKPERFLDESGALLTKVEGFMPFSVGKRFCLGESLAKMELFIFFVSLLRHFRFVVPPGANRSTISSATSTLGVVQSPKPFTIIFEPR